MPSPRVSQTRSTIRAAMEKLGAATVAQLHQATGLHPARIRHMVTPPEYKRISGEKHYRQKEWTWALNTDHCECGKLASYIGSFTIMTGDCLKPRSMFLCKRCAQGVDKGVELVSCVDGCKT